MKVDKTFIVVIIFVFGLILGIWIGYRGAESSINIQECPEQTILECETCLEKECSPVICKYDEEEEEIAEIIESDLYHDIDRDVYYKCTDKISPNADYVEGKVYINYCGPWEILGKKKYGLDCVDGYYNIIGNIDVEKEKEIRGCYGEDI